MLRCGKGIYWWQIPAVCKGNLGEAIALLLSGGFQWVAVKCADADHAYIAPRLRWPTWGENVTRDTVRALQAAGLQVYGWGYCYGERPGAEGRIAASQVGRLGLDGWIFDVEAEFAKQESPGVRGETLVREFRELAPEVCAGLAYFPVFRSPETGSVWHSARLAERIMANLDFGSPMAYWGAVYGDTALDAVEWLDWSLSQWGEITNKPIIPAGRAYNAKNITARPEAITAFGERVRELGLPGELWWSLQHAEKLEDVWTSLIGLPGWDFAGPEPDAEFEGRIAQLELHVDGMIESLLSLQSRDAELVRRIENLELWAQGIAFAGGHLLESEESTWTPTS